ncbi:MAG: hypothetical protein QOF77_775 [Solirubrobacteraceae bacterium]|nr:hypothetical protein [Solirubrobacteraceae bacterium]
MPRTRVLPGRWQSDLLAAILLDGAPAREAWERWTRFAGDPKRVLGADAVMARPLLALLYDSVRRNRLAVDGETATYLRSAFFAESLRSRAYREILDEVVGVLRAAEIRFLLVKGAAVGALYYADPALRHAHDIEMLVEDVGVVGAALGPCRFGPAGAGLVHESGLPLRLHTRLLGPAPLWESTTLAAGAGTLDPAHALALALVDAGGSCRWACDARMIVGAAQVDWSAFADAVIAVDAARAVHAQARWLVERLGVEIPAAVLASLAVRQSPIERTLRAVRRRTVPPGVGGAPPAPRIP